MAFPPRYLTPVVCSTLLCCVIAGCASPSGTGKPEPRTSQPFAERPKRERDEAATLVQRDPLAFLDQVLARTEQLSQYTLTFYRQERIGTFRPKLTDPELIHARFRRIPFSAKFDWPDPAADYAESLYVEGQNDNKLIVRERKGILGFPPQTRRLNVGDPVKLGRSKNPITDFGLEQSIRRTLMSFHDPRLRDHSRVEYRGVMTLDLIDRPVHHFHIERRPDPAIRYTTQDYYVDTATLLPAGTDLYLPDGTLDAKYRYKDVDAHAHVTDADFTLHKK